MPGMVPGAEVIMMSEGGILDQAVLQSSHLDAVEVVLRQFLENAVRCRGLAPATRRAQELYIQRFLDFRFPAGDFDAGRIVARDLQDYILAYAKKGQFGAARDAASALRGFLRFLVQHGSCCLGIIDAVPAVGHRSARLPRHLSADQVAKLLETFDRSQPSGRRGFAMATCMVYLGLRVSEVVGLRLEDLDWRAGTLRIEKGKARRADAMPLPELVGQAIADYLHAGRPHTVDRHVFVTHGTPVGQPLDPCAARMVIRRAFLRAELNVASRGTHALRHTLATAMVCNGASLKEVADVLRHRNLDTTVIYARVDLPALRSVAAPWPEVHS